MHLRKTAGTGNSARRLPEAEIRYIALREYGWDVQLQGAGTNRRRTTDEPAVAGRCERSGPAVRASRVQTCGLQHPQRMDDLADRWLLHGQIPVRFPQVADRKEDTQWRRRFPKALQNPEPISGSAGEKCPQLPSSGQLMNRSQLQNNVHVRPAAPRANGPASAANASPCTHADGDT